MNKIILLFLFLFTAIVFGLLGSYFGKNIFLNVLDQQREEDRLQNLSFTQMVLEHLDKGEFDKAREEVLSLSSSLVYNLEPIESYSVMKTEACEIHKIIHKYRQSVKEKYIPENPIDEEIQNILEDWSKIECS